MDSRKHLSREETELAVCKVQWEIFQTERAHVWFWNKRMESLRYGLFLRRGKNRPK